mmetsp:Transcript_39550/g.85408  ORF Transcript_39550/g.85408 Transcript_39550/m.85408 type:complete len:217 (-) Transcript_39550:6-656(-)
MQVVVQELHGEANEAMGQAHLSLQKLLLPSLQFPHELLLLHFGTHEATEGRVLRHVQQHLHHVLHGLWPEKRLHQLLFAFFHRRCFRSQFHPPLLLHVHQEGLDLLLSPRLIILDGLLQLQQEASAVPRAEPFLQRKVRDMLFQISHIFPICRILLMRLTLLNQLPMVLVEHRKEPLEEGVHVFVERLHGEGAKTMGQSLLWFLLIVRSRQSEHHG